MPEFVLVWAPSADYTIGQTLGNHHTSLGRFGAGVEERSSIGLPVGGWLRNLIIRVPDLVPADPDNPFENPELVNPGNTKENPTPISFRADGVSVATVSIGGLSTGEFSAIMPVVLPYISAGYLVNDRIEDGGNPGLITISVVLARIDTDWRLITDLSLALNWARENLLSTESSQPPTNAQSSDMTAWNPDTCGCVIVANNDWTELKFLKACSCHKASGMNESNIHNEHKNINRKCVGNKNVRLDFIRKVRKFNSDSEQSMHCD